MQSPTRKYFRVAVAIAAGALGLLMLTSGSFEEKLATAVGLNAFRTTPEASAMVDFIVHSAMSIAFMAIVFFLILESVVLFDSLTKPRPSSQKDKDGQGPATITVSRSSANEHENSRDRAR